MTTRRNVIVGLGAAAAGALSLKARATTVSRPGTAFGTTVSITVTANSETQSNHAIDAGFAEIHAVHKAASLFDAGSEISRLNMAYRLDQPSFMFRHIAQISDMLHHLSQGAFDPSIQPLWSMWQNGPPSEQDVADALARVGWQHFSMSDQHASLANHAALSFNGIAQGYAADRVMFAVREAGAIAASIDTGEIGRLNADGALAIQHPRHNVSLGLLKITDGFVAVSGDYATSFTPDFLHHHIFDPKRGFSPRELASVAVVAPTGAFADGLATAFMVMGVEKSLACLRQVQACSALFMDKAGAITLSPGMESLFQKT
jgi:FAD:protein FMN transferase